MSPEKGTSENALLTNTLQLAWKEMRHSPPSEITIPWLRNRFVLKSTGEVLPIFNPGANDSEQATAKVVARQVEKAWRSVLKIY